MCLMLHNCARKEKSAQINPAVLGCCASVLSWCIWWFSLNGQSGARWLAQHCTENHWQSGVELVDPRLFFLKPFPYETWRLSDPFVIPCHLEICGVKKASFCCLMWLLTTLMSYVFVNHVKIKPSRTVSEEYPTKFQGLEHLRPHCVDYINAFVIPRGRVKLCRELIPLILTTLILPWCNLTWPIVSGMLC